MTRVLLALLAAAAGACATPHRAPAVGGPSAPNAGDRLASANALVREGCLDCLEDAFREYSALQSVASVADAAADGAVVSGGLIALRERELGMVDEGYLDRAKAVASASPARQDEFGEVLDFVDAVPARGGARDSSLTDRFTSVLRNRTQWSDRFRVKADAGPLWGAAWVWFACTYGQTRADRELNALLGPVVTLHDAPLIMYEAATCAVGGDTLLADLAASDPRFHEIEFWTGSRQVAVQDLDGAQTTLTRAYGWHPAWPAVINSLANLYLTAEDFQTALGFYERSIALVPGAGESLLGRVRALSYLGRSEEAIARATELLPIGPPGDAYYWRAWNENRLDRLEPAWEDVEAARRLWVNSEVLKLAGLVAYRRRELDIARDRFESALKIPGNSDCEVVFDLAGVNVELASWNVGANLYASAATCFDQLRAGLAAEIAKLQQSGGNPDRVGRQVSSREEQRAGALRLQIQSWFNGAVANLQLGRREAARDLAEKVQEDDQFGARAKEILKRIQ